MKYQYIFGPVLSRRLGLSLGIDLVPHKTCTLDCVYCECDKTSNLTLHQDEYVPLEVVRNELTHFWNHHGDPDYITFSGSGEPTLNHTIGKVISFIKTRKPGIKVAVLTNATLLTEPEVRQHLLKADLVVPSLDAVSPRAFTKINRPQKNLIIGDIIDGIRLFSNEFKGKIYLEVFILPGFNDSETELTMIKKAVHQIKPDRVQLNTLDRPGTLSGIQPATLSDLDRVKHHLDFQPVEIIADPDKHIQASPVQTDPELHQKEIQQTILTTIHRRPCTHQDLLQVLGIEETVLKNVLNKLEKKRKIGRTTRERGIFFHTLKDDPI